MGHNEDTVSSCSASMPQTPAAGYSPLQHEQSQGQGQGSEDEEELNKLMMQLSKDTNGSQQQQERGGGEARCGPTRMKLIVQMTPMAHDQFCKLFADKH